MVPGAADLPGQLNAHDSHNGLHPGRIDLRLVTTLDAQRNGMHFWLKFFHIAAMSVWFVGLFFLPRLFVAQRRDEPDADRSYFLPVAKTLYFQIMTPAGIVTITLGMVLMLYAQREAWLIVKLAVVALAVLVHLYLGVVLYDCGRDRDRHGAWFHRVVGWLPLLLLLALAALTAAKPRGDAMLPTAVERMAHQSAGGRVSDVVPTVSLSP